MNDAIIIFYDPFSMESRINIFKNGNSKYANVASNIKELAEQIVSLAESEEIYEVKSHAPLDITKEIKTEVQSKEMQSYSTNKITVEGI